MCMYAAGRCLFFVLTPLFIDGEFDVYQLRSPFLWILNDLCALLFLSTFAALVLFWYGCICLYLCIVRVLDFDSKKFFFFL